MPSISDASRTVLFFFNGFVPFIKNSSAVDKTGFTGSADGVPVYYRVFAESRVIPELFRKYHHGATLRMPTVPDGPH
jgi:hypothetical protein